MVHEILTSEVIDYPETASDKYAFPATIGQQAFWYLNQLHPGTSAHHIALRFRATGSFRRDVFDRSVNELCRRHESLRTTFRHDGNQLLQLISPHTHRFVRFLDLSSHPTVDREADRLMTEEARHSFDLETGPLIRFAILKISDQTHLILLTVHHIVSDGWSTGIMLKEIATLYEAFEQGELSPLPEPMLQFADYAVWQDEWLHSDAIESQVEYWKRTLGNASAVLIPHDRIQPPVTREGKIESILLPRDLTEALTKWSVEQGATLFATTLACLYLLVYSRTNRTNLTLGTLIAGRTRTELESVVGLFVNTLVLRTEIGGDPSFVELLNRVRETVSQAFENQEIPFGRVVESLPHLKRGQSNPLFRINFLYQRAFLETQQAGLLTIEPIRALSPGALLDLNFFMVQRDEGWRLSCEYSADEYYPETILRLLLDVQTLIREVVSNPARPISVILETALQRPIGLTSRASIQETNTQTNLHEGVSASIKLNPQIPASTLHESSSHSEFEPQIRRIWEEVLLVRDIRESSDFFELGGHSLKAAQLLAKLKLQLNVRLTPAWLFQSPTLADMVNAVHEIKHGSPRIATIQPHENGQTHSKSNFSLTIGNQNANYSLTTPKPIAFSDTTIDSRKRVTNSPNERSTTLRHAVPMFFSKSNRPLFGAYEPPRSFDREEGIVFCSPIGHEYLKTHWCLRLLASECSKRGFHTFRFDYSGMGDSSGLFEQATIDQWIDDVAQAVQELSRQSGIDRITLVGLRLGATLAFNYAGRNPTHRLIMWDPVLEGQPYLDQYRQMNERLRLYTSERDTFAGEDLLGYSYSNQLIDDLCRLNLLNSTQTHGLKIGVLMSDQTDQANEWMSRWGSHRTRLTMRTAKEPAGWNDSANYDNAILLPEARRFVVELIQEVLS